MIPFLNAARLLILLNSFCSISHIFDPRNETLSVPGYTEFTLDVKNGNFDLTEAYLEPCQTSKMERFTKIVSLVNRDKIAAF